LEYYVVVLAGDARFVPARVVGDRGGARRVAGDPTAPRLDGSGVLDGDFAVGKSGMGFNLSEKECNSRASDRAALAATSIGSGRIERRDTFLAQGLEARRRVTRT
jgi:hypothetical protein